MMLQISIPTIANLDNASSAMTNTPQTINLDGNSGFTANFAQQLGILQTKTVTDGQTATPLDPSFLQNLLSTVQTTSNATTQTMQEFAALFGKSLPAAKKNETNINLDATLNTLSSVLQALQSLQADMNNTNPLDSNLSSLNQNSITVSTQENNKADNLQGNQMSALPVLANLNSNLIAEQQSSVPLKNTNFSPNQLNNGTDLTGQLTNLTSISTTNNNSKPILSAKNQDTKLANLSDLMANQLFTASSAKQIVEQGLNQQANNNSTTLLSNQAGLNQTELNLHTSALPNIITSNSIMHTSQNTPVLTNQQTIGDTGGIKIEINYLSSSANSKISGLSTSQNTPTSATTNMPVATDQSIQQPTLNNWIHTEAQAKQTISQTKNAKDNSQNPIQANALFFAGSDGVAMLKKSNPTNSNPTSNNNILNYSPLEQTNQGQDLTDSIQSIIQNTNSKVFDVKETDLVLKTDASSLSNSNSPANPIESNKLPDLPSGNTQLNQNLNADKLQPNLVLNQAINHPDWNQELGQKMLWMNNQNIQSADIQINPPHLGPLSIKVDVNNDQTSITFTTQHSEVKQAIEAAIPKLREMFGDQQLNLVDVNVSQQQSQQKSANNFFQMGSDQNNSNKARQDNQQDETSKSNTISNIAETPSISAINATGQLSLFA